MHHNSFNNRESLLAMNRHPVVKERRAVHRNVGRRPGAQPASDQFLLSGSWVVECATGHDAEQLVAADARDFLQRLDVVIEPQATNYIRFEIGSREAGFRCISSPQKIEIHAADAAAMWAGWVHFENEMRANGGPILTQGEVQREPAWDVQISPTTWGANFFVPDLSPEYLGDDTFEVMAHHGADGMLLYGDFLAYTTGTRFPELEHPDATHHLEVLHEAAQRALRYGIRFYYCLVSPKLPAEHPVFAAHPNALGARLQGPADAPFHCLCSSDSEALAFHADVTRTLFTAVPELGGLILIVGGESYYHCFMRAADAEIGESNCPVCDGKVAEEVIANFVKVTADAAHAVQPNAKIMAWPYSSQVFWAKEINNFQLIDRLPGNVALLSEIDKEQLIRKDGYDKLLWDYSVDYDGHSDRIVNQALRCSQRELDLYIKTETGHGIELLHFPYVPSIQRSARKWQSVRALRPRGIIQRWGFIGMFDSVAERIGYQARWNPSFAPDAAAQDVAAQLMGAAAPEVVRAWGHFDLAVGHIPTLILVNYYIGPMFLGPAHPLPVWEGETPDAFRGHLYYLVELEATFSDTHIHARDDLTLHSLQQHGPFIFGLSHELLESEFATARDLASEGCRILEAVDVPALPPHERSEVEEQRAMGEYLHQTFRTTFNTLKFIRLKEAGAERSTLHEIAYDELGNTRNARRIYEAAPWLNHALRLDVGMPDSIRMVEEKIRLLEAYTTS
ncbi:MAG TPA: hypothetical protein VNA16_01750 [Abditibacteriaceae bacterium]|nr:hypothetical protein [Abditibacteriaceae bacterium]